MDWFESKPKSNRRGIQLVVISISTVFSDTENPQKTLQNVTWDIYCVICYIYIHRYIHTYIHTYVYFRLKRTLEAQNRRIDDLLEKIRQQQDKLEKQGLHLQALQEKVPTLAT